MYRSVYELNEQEIYQLQEEMYYGTDEHRPLNEIYDYPEDIPVWKVEERYDGVCFVEEDFWCNVM